MSLNFDVCWKKIQYGDEKALKDLFTETSENLCQYAFQITEDIFLAEEVVQDVFVRLWEQRRTIIIQGSPKAYLYKAVHNESVNSVIRQRTQKNAVSRLVSDESWQVIEDNYQIDDFVIERLEAEDTGKIIDRIIQELPSQNREIFILSRFENKSNLEIAAILNLSVSTVKTQIYRAVNKIREELLKK
jgi:RNA polymerase sigma-70 factor (ECF subfamily)